MNPGQILGGAVMGGIAADLYDKAKDKAKDASGQPQVDHGPIEMQMIVDMLSEFLRDYREAQSINCAPMFKKQVLQLNNQQGLQMKRGNWKHVSMLVPIAGVTIGVQTEIGEIDFAVNKGWNAFDMPNDSVLWVTAGSATPLTVILYFGDDALDIPGV